MQIITIERQRNETYGRWAAHGKMQLHCRNCFSIEIIFRFIPLLIDEASAIIKTQLVRGGLGKAKGHASRIKAAIPLLVPLISQTIRRSEALADALTMRCFR